MPGMRTSINTTSGRNSSTQPHGFCAVARSADHGEIGPGVEQLGEAGAHDLMVVGDDDPHLLRSPAVIGLAAAVAGSVASTRNPPPIAAPKLKSPADSCGAFAHAEQSVRALRCLKRRPWPVVAHAQAQHLVGVTQLDVDGSARGVPPRICQRLLRDAVGSEFDAWIERDRRAVHDEPGA